MHNSTTPSKKVAVIGYAFRFPGSSTQSYWPSLLAGRDLVTEVDASRWEKAPFLHPDKNHQGASYTFAAGSIGDISQFDAGFFGISPREAALMDPQQRLLLELSWEALENSAIRPSALKGSRCGVYIGISTADYSFRLADDLAAVDASVATGNTASIAANRISFVFDLRSPSIAVDTACSSSLVAFHLACQSILSGESVQALTGGVSLHAHPYGFITFSKASMLSKHGRCNVFDAAGDGYVRSEGGGVFFIKDYDAAVADGNRILAVVAHSAVNTDGRKSGLTVPSADAQSALLAESYARAKIDPDDIDYIEAHGTGTAVGDPIETRALGMALGQRRRKDRPLLIGSVKSNLGHLEAASGVAGLVKALHCIQHRLVPATIGIENPNPNILFKDWNIEVVTENRPLKKTGKVIIGTNSFGFGGANAHVILESYDNPADKTPRLSNIHDLPVLVSAKSGAALKAAARELAVFIGANPQIPFYDISYNTCFARDWHDQRALVFGRAPASVAEALQAFVDGSATVVDSGVAIGSCVGPAFVYTGNGSQWAGMGKALLEQDVVFRNAIREIDAIFQRYADWSIEAEFKGETASADSKAGAGGYEYTEIAQPALFALQVGITQMLRHRGVRPVAVAGHSVGEVTAAWASGALTLEAAVQVIYQRSRLQGATKGTGTMTAAVVDAMTATGLIDELDLGAEIALAGINSARGVNVAGPAESLARFEDALKSRGIIFRRLSLDYAFHSPAMDCIELDLLHALRELRAGEASIPLFSTVTGDVVDGRELHAGYWWQNIRLPVLFADAVRNMLAKGINVFVEIGPHAILQRYLNDAIKENDAPGKVIPTVARNDGAPQRIWSAANQVMIAGCEVDWGTWLPRRGRFVELPNYPWQRERHWHPVTPEAGGLLARKIEHPLLGYRLARHDLTWENPLDIRLQPSLADHVVGNATVFPGSGFAELAIAAALAWLDGDFAQVDELEIRSPLLLSDTQSKVIRTTIDPADGGFSVNAREYATGQIWSLHATGRLLREPRALPPADARIEIPPRQPDFNHASHETLTLAAGLTYGPAFRLIDRGWVEGNSAIAVFDIPAQLEGEIAQTRLHPAILDCTFQLIIQLLRDQAANAGGCVYVPTRIERITCRADGRRPHCARATLLRQTRQSVVAEFTLFDETGRAIANLEGVRFRSIRLQHDAADRFGFVEERFVPVPHALAPFAGAVISPARVQDAIADGVKRCAAGDFHHRYVAEVEPLLDEVCGRFGMLALRSLSDDGHHLSHTKLAALQQARAGNAPFLRHLIGAAREDGVLRDAQGGYDLMREEPFQPSAGDIWNSLVADYTDCFDIVHRVGRIGYHLEEILEGGSASLSATAKTAPRYSPVAQVLGMPGRQQLGEAFHKIAAQALQSLPPEQRLRIVEISEMPPLFASDICAAVNPDRCDYRYITLSQAAMQEAARQQDRFPFMQLSLADDRDVPQPIAASRGAHLVVLSLDFANITRALRALDIAQVNLAPGGSIVLVGLHPSRWLNFAGCEESGWWQEMADGSLVAAQQPARFWVEQLVQRGFESPAEISFSTDIKSGPYVLLAGAGGRISAPATAAAAKLQSRSWLIVADESGYSARLGALVAAHLRKQGDSAVATGARDAVAIGEALAAIAQQAGRVDGVLHLAGLFAEQGSKPDPDLARQADRCLTAAAIVEACERAQITPACWLITSGAMAPVFPDIRPAALAVGATGDAALWGWGRTLMNEAPKATIRLVDLQAPEEIAAASDALGRELLSPDSEREIILTADGGRFAPRLAFTQALPGGSAQQTAPVNLDAATVRLGFEVPGQLRNLRWESHPRVPPEDDEIEVEVHASGINFRDLMYTLGMLSEESMETGFAGPTLGLEFAGVVLSAGNNTSGFAAGDRVVGFGPSSLANRVVTRSTAVSHIPGNLSFEAAATIPSAFFTVYYALHNLAKLEQGESVLIHGAAGGVGNAAVQIANWRGATIHATAGSDEKRNFLRLLGVEHVYDSRSLAFADDILAVTGGQGVDVVLNSLAGEAVNRNLRVLKPFGRFIELGKRNIYENTKIGLRPFRNNISYFGVDADQLMHARPALARGLFDEVMRLFGEGILHPLPYHVFGARDIVDAFRYMQQAKQIGKIVVTYHNRLAPTHASQVTQPRRLQLGADATYLVTGGLSGFGLRTATWLAERGARHLVLINRRGPGTEEAVGAIKTLQARGVTVLATSCDVRDKQALSSLFAGICASMPPLKGIVHAATVIEDGLIRNVTHENLTRVLAPKVLGAQHLHALSAELPLDFFILFSSATTLFGNPGQGSYVAANAAIESLAAQRRAAGLPATCVRWGAIDDVGFLARNERIKEALQNRMGGSALQSAVALDALEKMLLSGQSGLGVMELDWRAVARFLPTATSPRFGELVGLGGDAQTNESTVYDIQRLLIELPDDALLLAFIDMIKAEIAEILRAPMDSIDAYRSMYEMGLDSLMGVELMLALEGRFGVSLPAMTLSESRTVAKLAGRIIGQLRGAEDASADAAALAQVQQVVARHAADVTDDSVAEFAKDMSETGLAGQKRIIR